MGLKRAKENPILKPLKNNSWEAKAVFNPAALYLEGRVHLLYRAMSEDNTSVLGYASSKDGINIDYRSPKPVYLPKEPFEQKLVSGGNSGCEDPRLTRIKDKIYLTYTAFDGRNPARVALSSIKIKNFLSQCWRWTKPVLISPPGFDDKDAFIFPEKIRGDFAVVHRSGDDIDLGFTPALKFKKGEWLGEYRWIAPRRGWWDSKKVGAAAPPVKTKSGWVFLYHGVSEDKIYRVGAVLLDLANPIKIIGRTIEPIFEPEENYEKEGQVANVVFPCGNVVLEDKLYVYYGGADQVIGVATTRIKKLVSLLERF
ncbi:MAG: glycosidase [Candidatus Shapirobacteria bacterium]